MSESQANPSVVVTGSSGLLGQSICERLATFGYEVFGLDRVRFSDLPENLEGIHFIQCDLADDGAADNALAEIASCKVIPAATIFPTSRSRIHG